jgi:DNA repair exonuclease SbcCD ATPase subunit
MIRDPNSKALIETDTAELTRYRTEKKRQREIDELKRDMKSLRSCINNLCETIKRIEDRS